jgi:hypothetical protein
VYTKGNRFESHHANLVAGSCDQFCSHSSLANSGLVPCCRPRLRPFFDCIIFSPDAVQPSSLSDVTENEQNARSTSLFPLKMTAPYLYCRHIMYCEAQYIICHLIVYVNY